MHTDLVRELCEVGELTGDAVVVGRPQDFDVPVGAMLERSSSVSGYHASRCSTTIPEMLTAHFSPSSRRSRRISVVGVKDRSMTLPEVFLCIRVEVTILQISLSLHRIWSKSGIQAAKG